MFEPEPALPKIKFRIIGIVSNSEFQICRCYTERLHKSYPNEYAEPDIRPLLDVDWSLYLTKIRRKIGGAKLWALKKNVVVFKDGEVLGDNADLLKMIAERFQFTIAKNFDTIGNQKLIEYLRRQSDLGRHFVYFTIAVDHAVIGSMLFQLYNDLVPQITKMFLERCVKKHHGYVGTPIQRIVIPSWIQCGGWDLKHRTVPCENYVVPHDKRGVLSMCHNGKHNDNSTQFLITLDPTPWMDYKYVALGQLIQGEGVLRAIEKVPAFYEVPSKKIEIVKSGEFIFYPTHNHQSMLELGHCLATGGVNICNSHKSMIDLRDVESVLLERRLKRGLYSGSGDLQSYRPFCHLPDDLICQFLTDEIQGEGSDYGLK